MEVTVHGRIAILTHLEIVYVNQPVQAEIQRILAVIYAEVVVQLLQAEIITITRVYKASVVQLVTQLHGINLIIVIIVIKVAHKLVHLVTHNHTDPVVRLDVAEE